MRSKPKTSWSYENLKELTLPKNHRVIFDGFEYVWESKTGGSWSRHYIINFDSVKKYESYLLYNISRWTTEVKDRKDDFIRNEIRKKRKDLKAKNKELKKIVTIYKKPLKNLKKIKMILEVNSSVSNKDIYTAIGLSKTQFYNYINKIQTL